MLRHQRRLRFLGYQFVPLAQMLLLLRVNFFTSELRRKSSIPNLNHVKFPFAIL
jgi:hypothetical protein